MSSWEMRWGLARPFRCTACKAYCLKEGRLLHAAPDEVHGTMCRFSGKLLMFVCAGSNSVGRSAARAPHRRACTDCGAPLHVGHGPCSTRMLARVPTDGRLASPELQVLCPDAEQDWLLGAGAGQVGAWPRGAAVHRRPGRTRNHPAVSVKRPQQDLHLHHAHGCQADMHALLIAQGSWLPHN